MHGVGKLIVFTIAFAGWFGCSAAAETVVRGADVMDPISGLHWLRLTDSAHPAAPPRLTLSRNSGSQASGTTVRSTKTLICVRAGDRVLLQRDDHGPAQMSLEATALGSGAVGDRIRARVTVTGALVEIRIAGAGRGFLSREAGDWR
jgi:hypothetical protein